MKCELKVIKTDGFAVMSFPWHTVIPSTEMTVVGLMWRTGEILCGILRRSHYLDCLRDRLFL